MAPPEIVRIHQRMPGFFELFWIIRGVIGRVVHTKVASPPL